MDKTVSQPERELSWQKIFDMDWHADDIADERGQKSIQGAFWEIRKEYVVDYTLFKAR